MNWIVTRHAGALEWLLRRVPEPRRHITHWGDEPIAPGDTVYGTLPLERIAQLGRIGARYMHLAIDLPRELRGVELDADTMDRLGARLCHCKVWIEDPAESPCDVS